VLLPVRPGVGSFGLLPLLVEPDNLRRNWGRIRDRRQGRQDPSLSPRRRVAASPRRRVAAELIAAIEAGEYPPGSQLPGEARLAERFQRPRNTVHSALGELDGRGLVEVVHDKGRIVLARPGDT
jgi:hypothetical protein